jgi:DNA-binding HxlR family transcriptional regulator
MWSVGEQMTGNEKPAIAEIVELLGKKWVMRIIWELRGAPLTFRELQKACENLSPTVLNSRLKLLREARLVEKGPDRGYGLTGMGRELLEVYKPLNRWAVNWQLQRNQGEN